MSALLVHTQSNVLAAAKTVCFIARICGQIKALRLNEMNVTNQVVVCSR